MHPSLWEKAIRAHACFHPHGVNIPAVTHLQEEAPSTATWKVSQLTDAVNFTSCCSLLPLLLPIKSSFLQRGIVSLSFISPLFAFCLCPFPRSEAFLGVNLVCLKPFKNKSDLTSAQAQHLNKYETQQFLLHPISINTFV